MFSVQDSNVQLTVTLFAGATAPGHIRFVAVENGGSLKTVDGFDGPAVDATFVYGADWMKLDGDRGYARLDFQGIFK